MRSWSRGSGRLVVGCALAWLGGACLPTAQQTVCADGLVCAAPRVCAPAGGGCADAEQVTACDGLAAGAVCTLEGVGMGQCRAGLCVVTACGDGVVDAGEACDDGNSIDGDACTNACAPPTCGDGAVQGVEACDDGAGNGDDRACTSRCLRAVCGDNLTLAGVEECDAGPANSDGDACTLACTRNVCGDGALFAGVEACDDGPAGVGVSGDGCRADCRKVEACGDGLVDAGEACDDANANPADGCDACVATTWLAEALIAGNRDAARAGLARPYGVAIDLSGTVYVADTWNSRVLRVDPATGIITTVAGTTTFGYSGDGGPATSAQLWAPAAVAVDGLGTVFIADTANSRIRRIDATTGVITTVAGSATEGYAGDGGLATSARLSGPTSVVVDGQGNLTFAEAGNHCIRRVDHATGIITTVAGTGIAGDAGDGGAATSARLRAPNGVALDGAGHVYISDTENHRIKRVDASTGIITTIAGTGTAGLFGEDAPALTAQFNEPHGLAVDGLGRIYVADTHNHLIRRIDGTTIRIVAGGPPGYGGDGGPATSARLLYPIGVAATPDGSFAVADTYNQRIRWVDAASGQIGPLAGSGTFGRLGDDGAAISAQLGNPSGIALDPQGRLLIADRENFRVRRVDAATGVISTVVGTGTAEYTGDGGPATEARVDAVAAVVAAPTGTLYVADPINQVIRRVDGATQIITTVAGSGVPGDSGDGAAATSARVRFPQGLALDDDGHLFIADTLNHRVRRVDAQTGIITTVAGTGTPGASGDLGLATLAQLAEPHAIALDATHLYIADRVNHRVRRVDRASGIITTFAGTGSPGFSGDDVAATSSQLYFPSGVALGPAGDLYIVDSENHRVRKVDRQTGLITTVAGNGTAGFAGDGGVATSARLKYPSGVAIDAQGNVFFSDRIYAGVVRRIDATTGILSTVAGRVDPDGMGPIDQARLATPEALVLAAPFALVAGGVSGTIQAIRPTTLDVVAGRYGVLDNATGNLARFRANYFGTVGGVAYDAAAGRIYVTESNAHVVHVVDVVDAADATTWTIDVFAGQFITPGFADGALSTSQFRGPTGLYFDDASRVLYVADTDNHAVRAIDVEAGTVTTVAGTPATLGYFGDGGAATDALLFQPTAVTRCAGTDDLYFADTGNHRIRRIASGSGVITTVLGDGVAASSGQGAPASTFPVDAPRGLACDALGNLYATSTTTVRLLPADDAGVVDGSGPVQSIYGAPPRTLFPASIASCLTGIAVVDGQTLQVTDSCTGLLVELWRQPSSPL